MRRPSKKGNFDENEGSGLFINDVITFGGYQDPSLCHHVTHVNFWPTPSSPQVMTPYHQALVFGGDKDYGLPHPPPLLISAR